MTKNKYNLIIEKIFFSYFHKGIIEIPFERHEIFKKASEIGIEVPKNLGDVVYSVRYRTGLPESIINTQPEGMEWIIRPAGKSRYLFVLTKRMKINPSESLAETKIPDATPGIIEKYALNDEQALLAKLRYNRLIDIFTGITCYSLQNHLRTSVPGMGQIETDEIYIGIDRTGVQYVFPVQAKGARDNIGIIQIEQDFAMCEKKFTTLLCRPLAAQFMKDRTIALFAFEKTMDDIRVSVEKHYRLVPPDEVTTEDLQNYRKRYEP